MRRLFTWLKRIGVAIYVLVAGAAGGGGPVIVDRREMYGHDPANDPYSIEYDPKARRSRGTR